MALMFFLFVVSLCSEILAFSNHCIMMINLQILIKARNDGINAQPVELVPVLSISFMILKLGTAHTKSNKSANYQFKCSTTMLCERNCEGICMGSSLDLQLEWRHRISHFIVVGSVAFYCVCFKLPNRSFRFGFYEGLAVCRVI